MLRFLKRPFLTLIFAGIIHTASAFSLLGPYATWESAALGYNALLWDIGGPMNLGEGYRWNEKTVTYGFDKSFQDYFGQRGIEEVNKAIAIFNGLPPASQMSASLSEFPQDTRRENYQAESLGLADLKTYTMGLLASQVGMTDPERYVWTLRSRVVVGSVQTNYFVLMRNFDPATWVPTPYVNGTLYTYSIEEFGPAPQYSDAVESTVDPLAIGWNTVAGIPIESYGNVAPSSYNAGNFFTGLTRDDVGAIRYLLNKKLLNVESQLPGTITATTGGAWMPVGSGGGGGSNNIVNLALRRGINKIQFKQLKYYGPFPGFTNVYTDTYYTNGQFVSQRVERIQTAPDIVFTAGDLGVSSSGSPVLTAIIPTTSGWANNSALNTPPIAGVEVDGPGVIQPTVVIAFSNSGPWIANVFPGFLDQANEAATFGGWAAFDGTTNAPFIFPNGGSIQALQQNILNSGGL